MGGSIIAALINESRPSLFTMQLRLSLQPRKPRHRVSLGFHGIKNSDVTIGCREQFTTMGLCAEFFSPMASYRIPSLFTLNQNTNLPYLLCIKRGITMDEGIQATEQYSVGFSVVLHMWRQVYRWMGKRGRMGLQRGGWSACACATYKCSLLPYTISAQ